MSRPPGFALRRTWKNHLGNQWIDPLRIYAPPSIDEVRQIVREAEEARVTVRAVGSGHSWSDVALTRGFLLKTDGLARPVTSEQEFLRPEWTGRQLVRPEGGIRIKELNAYLDGRGLALSNMGGYDHQTVAGVISTSTHGSGLTFGPLNDFVRSLDIVAAGGQVYRIEPSDGPTTPRCSSKSMSRPARAKPTLSFLWSMDVDPSRDLTTSSRAASRRSSSSPSPPNVAPPEPSSRPSTPST